MESASNHPTSLVDITHGTANVVASQKSPQGQGGDFSLDYLIEQNERDILNNVDINFLFAKGQGLS